MIFIFSFFLFFFLFFFCLGPCHAVLFVEMLEYHFTEEKEEVHGGGGGRNYFKLFAII